MENQKESPTKQCPHCKAEIPVSAKKCSHCGSDLRSWINRHPVWVIIIVLIVVFWVLADIGHNMQPTQQISTPTQSGQNANTTQTSIPLNQNNPSIKQLGTLASDYVGQSFVLDVNAETANYYNYGFSNDGSYYSLTIWDDSVGGDYEGIYAYLPKNDANKQLANLLLNASQKLEIHASIPTTDWESNSNAFLLINSWKLLNSN